jgi:flagellar motility protein MotE (MotC chaperone)
LKNNPKNLLNMIHEKNNQDSINVNEPPTFTELIQNFLDKEKLTNNKELQEQKVELNKKIQNIRSMKEQNRNFLKNKFVS